MDSLRQEILEAQNRRADLIKWKLLLVSALAATGLGLTNAPNIPYIELVLCCIPFVCAYVDSLCYHQALILVVIGEFIRSRAKSSKENPEQSDFQDISQYEIFSLQVRELPYRNKTISAYDLEKINLKWSSLIFSTFLIIYSISQYSRLTYAPIFVSGIIGIFLTIFIQKSYNIRRDKIRVVSK